MVAVDARVHARAPFAKRQPSWAFALATVLVAAGLNRRSAAAPAPPAATREEHHDPAQRRYAAKPSDIPARGWKDALHRVYRRVSQDRIVAISAGVTFYALLAIFPAIAALVSIYGLFADPASVRDHLAGLSGVMPRGGIEIVGEQMNRVASQRPDALGAAFIIGLAVSLWSANAGMKAIFDALNVVYNEPEKRGFVKLNALSLLFTISVIAFVVVAMGAIVVLPVILGYLGFGSAAQWLIQVGKWPALLAAVTLVIGLLYRFGPSRDPTRWRWISWGSAFAAIGWFAVSLLFAWYAANFASYNKTYGSLGAAIGFMTWIWISTIVVLLGATLNAEMTKPDTAGETA